MKYKFRAEGRIDVGLWLVEMAIKKYSVNYLVIEPWTIQGYPVPDVTVSFRSKTPIKEIINVMEIIPDSHVMIKTILPIKLYTGERLRR